MNDADPRSVDPNMPTYLDLVTLLRSAPPMRSIPDDRYWAWCRKAEALLARLPESA